MKRSFLIAGLLAVGAAAWVASGQLDSAEPVASKPPADLGAGGAVATVRVREQSAQTRTAEVVLRGRTEARRKVDVKAETHGRIIELPLEEGARVQAGDVLVRLAPEDRPARLAEAQALLEQRRMEYEAARRLAEKGFRAETQLAASKAALEAAQAALERAAVENANTVIEAPLGGVLGERQVEVGDFVEQGDPVARILELDPILAVAQISERNVLQVSVGDRALIRPLGGQEIEAAVRFIGREADPATRTYRLEAEAANPDLALVDGMTAELRVPLEPITAHLVSPAILSLAENGIVGVKLVGPDNTVVFQPVEIVGDDPKGVWLTGLPERVTLITVGQEFVTEGQRVRPIDEATLQPLATGGTS